MRSMVNTECYVGGLLDKSGGHIHPLNLALGEAAAVESLGGIIYEHSAAVRIQRGEPAVVFTEEGSVTADFLIVAGNAYLGGLMPELQAKSMPCGTQVVTTEPLSDEMAASLLPQDYCVEDVTTCWITSVYRATSVLFTVVVWFTVRVIPPTSKRLFVPKC
nr:FAD-dependent oxidoreductase [Enterovibrio nigricans]